jgi:ankyrin repeat protein
MQLLQTALQRYIAALLIDKGASLNAKNSAGQIALNFACDKGADLHCVTQAGKTALDLARMEGHDDIVQILTAAAE